jgi:hypothetical protein
MTETELPTYGCRSLLGSGWRRLSGFNTAAPTRRQQRFAPYKMAERDLVAYSALETKNNVCLQASKIYVIVVVGG